MKKLTTLAISTILAVGMSSTVEAADSNATLKQLTGTIQVNRVGADAFIGATEGMQLQVGDVLIALDGSAAVVVYQDGCDIKIKEGQELTVAKTDLTCAARVAVMSAGALGAGGATAAATGAAGAAAAVGGISTTGMLLGAAAIGTAYAVSSNNTSATPSQ